MSGMRPRYDINMSLGYQIDWVNRPVGYQIDCVNCPLGYRLPFRLSTRNLDGNTKSFLRNVALSIITCPNWMNVITDATNKPRESNS